MKKGPERIIFLVSKNLCLSVWISKIFYKKVQYHLRKVGIDFGGYGPNNLGIRDQKVGPKIYIFVIFKQLLMFKCMNLSEIKPQVSIL